MISEPGELAPIFTSQGFVPMRLLDNQVLDLDWKGEEDFIQKLGSQTKRRHARMLEQQAPLFRHEVWDATSNVSDEAIDQLHTLYLNLARKNFRINISPLPPAILRAHLRSGSWEFLVLWSNESGRTLPVAFSAARHVGGDYRWLYVGVDYHGFDVNEVSPYRQLLWQAIRRAGQLGYKRIHLGMGTDREKQKFGSVPVPTYAFVRSEDDYQAAQLQQFVEASPKKRAIRRQLPNERPIFNRPR